MTSRPQACNTQPNKGTGISKINHRRRRRTYSGRAKPPAGFDIRLTFTVRSAAGFNCDCFGCVQSQTDGRRVCKITHITFYLSLSCSECSPNRSGRQGRSLPPPHSSVWPSRETPNSGQFVPQPASHLTFPIDHHYHLFHQFRCPSSRKKQENLKKKKATFPGVVPSLKLTFGNLDDFQWAWGCRHECRRRW